MIQVIAVITAKPGMRGAVLDAIRVNLPSVHAEQRCIGYGAAVDLETAPGFRSRPGRTAS